MIGFSSCSKQEQATIEHGREVVHASLCIHCHGPQLNGTPQGPGLNELAEHWTEDKLMRYLEKPASTIRNEPRLQALTNQYKTIMPHFVMDERTRRSVAVYLLAERGGGK
jgi:cytochrome c2